MRKWSAHVIKNPWWSKESKLYNIKIRLNCKPHPGFEKNEARRMARRIERALNEYEAQKERSE